MEEQANHEAVTTTERDELCDGGPSREFPRRRLPWTALDRQLRSRRPFPASFKLDFEHFGSVFGTGYEIW
jgi:hypothetical protein